MALSTHPNVLGAIRAIHYAYPAVSFLYFFFALTITVCTLQTKALRIRDAAVRKDLILSLILGASGSYLIEAVFVLIQGLATSDWPTDQDRVVYLIASAITFGIQALALTDTKFPVWYPYYGAWFLGIAVEISLVILLNVVQSPASAFDLISITIQVVRTWIFILLPAVYFGFRNDKKEYDNCDSERQSLLRKKLAPKPSSSADSSIHENGNGNGAVNGYGTAKHTAEDSDSDSDSDSDPEEDRYIQKERAARKLIQKRLKQDGNWFTYAKGFSIFFPYIWPKHDKGLQFRAILVGVCLLSTNALNVLVPNQMGVMVDTLTKYTKGEHELNVWLPIALYAFLRFLSGGGCVGFLQRWLWIPMEQYSYNALNTASHAHIMHLSSDFHDSKTSSDLVQAVQGGKNVSDLLEIVCFQVLPMFIDLAVAVAYLWTLFGPYMGLMVATTATSYFYVTTKLISMRAQQRREYITVMRKEWTTNYSSINGWNTASLFNMIPYEEDKYSSAVKDHLGSKRTYEMSAQTINFSQGVIMALGLLGALSLGGFQVATGKVSVGRFTTLLVYWAQLAGPLGFFSTMFKTISYNLMDAERLLELFQTKPTIVDSPNAKPLKLNNGLVKFDRVSFAYDDRKPTLSDVSFTVPPGKTVAFVGETGGGKSTILKLMGRFYDVNAGSISIDGQDIRDVTIRSLREKVGVVPQDPTLFNDSIINNIRYSRLAATDNDVHEACKAAAIHDKIMTFPDGYNSIVGNNGVKLSGGEKQRVAIARAILKCPELILLDEATSAVDTGTEELIQKGFQSLCRGKTTFIVAHRLSTIMKADHIIVVMDGKVVEQGSHQGLIKSKGKYHELWSKQIFVDTERSRSRSPGKSNIVNDLSPALHKAELSKANASGKDGDKKVDDGQKPSGGHKREGSKLKPDAPEFVPLKAGSPGSKNVPKEVGKLRTRLERKASLTKKTSKPRGSRRDMSKSEPANQSNDGAQDTETTTSSGEGQNLQRRRVSAPSDPPGAQESRNTRPRRRHWRLKSRVAENARPGVNSSATTSGEASASETTVAPVPSPAESVPQRANCVTFAPGS